MENKSEVEISNIKINSFQDYISVGYLALLLLGMFRETVYYGISGINIINYSSIIDVILSPVTLLTEHIILFIALTCNSILIYLFYEEKKHGYIGFMQIYPCCAQLLEKLLKSP